MFLRLTFLGSCLFCIAGGVNGQIKHHLATFNQFNWEADTLNQISTKKTKEPKIKKVRNPKTAAYLALIPGGGQVYNGKYWKLVIYYGLTYFIYDDLRNNTQNKNFLHEILKIKDTQGPDEEITAIVQRYSTNQYVNPLDASFYISSTQTQIQQQYIVALSSIQSNYMQFAIVYGFGILDAVVDAHFSTYDISDDLSLIIKPKIWQNHHTMISGMSFKLTLK